MRDFPQRGRLSLCGIFWYLRYQMPMSSTQGLSRPGGSMFNKVKKYREVFNHCIQKSPRLIAITLLLHAKKSIAHSGTFGFTDTQVITKKPKRVWIFANTLADKFGCNTSSKLILKNKSSDLGIKFESE